MNNAQYKEENNLHPDLSDEVVNELRMEKNQESESQRNIPLGGSVEEMETKQNWEDRINSKLESAKWAFLAYGNQQGFKNHIKYADSEIAELKQFISHERHLAKQEILEEVIDEIKDGVGYGKFGYTDVKTEKIVIKMEDTISLLEELKKGSKL